MVRVAVLGPGLLGVKVTLTAQFWGAEPIMGLIPLAQVLVWLKSEEPDRPMLEKLSLVVVLKLRRTTVDVGLGTPTGWFW